MSDSGDRAPNLATLLQQAHALIDRRRYTQARQMLATAVQHQPDEPELLYLSAFIDYSEDKLDDAERTIQAVLLRDPEHYGARTLRAHLHESREELVQAETVWIELLGDYPDSPDLYANYADLMMRTMHFEKSYRLTQEGLRLQPDHPKSLYVAALLQMIQSRSQDADSEHLQQLLREHPERDQSLVALIIALNQQNKNKAALRVAQQLLSARPDSPEYLRLVKALKLQTHWSLMPLYPMLRWGWVGAGVMTVLGFGVIGAAKGLLSKELAGMVVTLWLAYVVYSWVWPRMLRNLI